MAAIVAVVGLMTGCSSTAPDSPGPTPATPAVTLGGGVPSLPTLSNEDRDACQTVFHSTPDPTSTSSINIVLDVTASMADVNLPSELVSAITQASLDGGTISLTIAQGADKPAKTLLNRVALAKEGDRDTATARAVALAAPTCVEDVIATAGPVEGEGTDIYPAMELASEMIGVRTSIWVLTDGAFNTGQIDLTQDGYLSGTPEAAASALGKAAPLDFKGSQFHIIGVANSAPAYTPYGWEWLRAFMSALCQSWNGEPGSCTSTALNPPPGTTRSTASLPGDPALQFPEIGVSDEPQTPNEPSSCTYSVPAPLAFDGDSAELRPDAASTLTGPIGKMQSNPGSTVAIVGHAASSRAYTDGELVQLSEKRAAAVAAVFSAAQIADIRITHRGAGNHEPVGGVMEEDLDPATGLQIPAIAATERRVTLTVKGVTCS